MSTNNDKSEKFLEDIGSDIKDIETETRTIKKYDSSSDAQLSKIIRTQYLAMGKIQAYEFLFGKTKETARYRSKIRRSATNLLNWSGKGRELDLSTIYDGTAHPE